jgi:hypothetical protein
VDLGVVVVEVGLVGEEAVPEVLAADGIPRPVGRLGVREDDPRLLVELVRVGPDVPVGLRVVLALRDSWNHAWSLDVWFMTRSAMTRIPRSWAASMNALTSSMVP